MTQAIAGAERDMASRFRNDLDTNTCGRGKSRIPLTDEERVHRVQWLEKYCGKIKRPHLKQSLVDFLKKQTEIVNTHTTKEAPEHSSISVSSASEQPSFPASSAPEHLVIETKRDHADAEQPAPKRIRQQKQTDTVQGSEILLCERTFRGDRIRRFRSCPGRSDAIY